MKLLISVFCSIVLLVGCNSRSHREAEVQQAKQMAVDSMNGVLAKQAVIDSMNRILAQRQNEIQEEENRKTDVVNNSTPVIKKKKKWNNTAKGAVIGAGTGAVAGAIIDNKKPVEGAIIGT